MTIDRTYLIFTYDGWLFTDWLYLPFFLGGQYQQCNSSNDKSNPNSL